jgi:hypothetical protein
VLLLLAVIGAVAFATDGGGNGAANEPPQQPEQVEPIADGATPAEDARNLANWLRENAGG